MSAETQVIGDPSPQDHTPCTPLKTTSDRWVTDLLVGGPNNIRWPV